MFKNLFDVIVGAISYATFGWAFSYGLTSDGGNQFIGNSQFWFSDMSVCEYAGWFFQWTFAATATTIVSGSMAGRTSIIGYMTYSTLLTGFIYPVVVHWTWSGNAWLTDKGFSDFAGSAVVHVTGGAVALVGAILLGPRLDRKRQKNFENVPPHSTPLVALGGFILAFGFFSFNGGSQLAIDDSDGVNGAAVALAMVNTIMAGAGGGLSAALIDRKVTGEFTLTRPVNGLLAGMVSICAGAASVYPWAAFVIGLIAGAVYFAWSKLLQKLKIDDAIDAVCVHMGAGWWGVLAAPLFNSSTGVFYVGNNDAFLGFAWNLAGVVTITVWAAGMGTLMFLPLKILGKLRVSEEVETQGLDVSEHGEKAYQMHSVSGPKTNGNGTGNGTTVFGV